MGLPIPQALIEKLGKEFIAKIDVKACIELLLHKLQEAVASLKGDANENGIIDEAEILADIAVVGQKLNHMASVLEAAAKKKKG